MTNKMNEEDILANLEESLEQHNYETAGFVSSYALPLSHDTTNNEEVILSQPIKFTRAVESFESADPMVPCIRSMDSVEFVASMHSVSSADPIVYWIPWI